MGRLIAIIQLLAFFAKELIVSNLVVARDALRPKPCLDPEIKAMELEALSDTQVFFLANLVTMTPGTLSLDLSPDKRILTIHTLYSGQFAALAESIHRVYTPLLRKAL